MCCTIEIVIRKVTVNSMRYLKSLTAGGQVAHAHWVFAWADGTQTAEQNSFSNSSALGNCQLTRPCHYIRINLNPLSGGSHHSSPKSMLPPVIQSAQTGRQTPNKNCRKPRENDERPTGTNRMTGCCIYSPAWRGAPGC